MTTKLELNALGKIELAEHYLRKARDLLKQAGCPKSADKVRSAIKSVQGAYRHAQNMHTREALSTMPTWPPEETRNPFLTVPDKSERPT